MAGRKVGGGKSMLGGNPDQAQAYILQHFRKFLVNFYDHIRLLAEPVYGKEMQGSY